MQGNRERGCFGLATGAFERTLGRAAEEARWRIKNARKGARGGKARGSRNWRVAGETGGRLAQICARNAFRRSRGLWGFFMALEGSLKLFLEGLWSSSLRLLRVFGAQQGSLGLKGYGLAVPLSFHRFIIISN